jgi:exopolyphosphatase/guanosine-5'-triphosphate,3'-diphosphate pyrophosphatase
MIKYILVLFVLVSCSQITIKTNCIEKRAAFDVGSGSTKMVVAEVDTCNIKINKILVESNRPITFKESLVKNKNNKLDKVIVNKAIKALLELKTLAKAKGATAFTGMATSAFRTAKNGKIALDSISQKTGISLKLINQKKEAQLGYFGVIAKLKHTPKNLVVWDIGGGSMQMTKNTNGKLSHYLGKLASVSFKEKYLKANKLQNIKSPNPINKTGAILALNLAEKFAIKDISNFKSEINSNTKFIGIGGVHYYSIRGQVNSGDSYYNHKQLKTTLFKRSTYTDSMLKSKYAATDVTNLALVLGYMKALNINKVETMKINMAHGLLVSNSEWP